MPTKTYKIQIAVSKTTSDGQAAKVQNDFKLATQYHAKGQLDLATELYKSTLKASPKHKVALFQLGAITSESDVKAAVALFDQAIAIDTNDPQPYFGKGYAFYKARNYEQALANYNKAIALRPDFELAYCNRGIIYLDLKRLRAALDDFAKAVILNPGNPKNYNNRGLALKEVKQNKLALADFDKAINLDPGYAEAYYNRGNTHRKLDRLREAEQDYAKALANDPDYQFLPGLHLHLKMFLCDWDNFDQAYQSLVEKIRQGRLASLPMPFVALSDDPGLQQQVTKIYVAEKYPARSNPSEAKPYPVHDKIRVGYFSGDFRHHPVALLTAEMFESHDKARFETYAFSLSGQSNDDMRKRLIPVFDRFIDVHTNSDREIVDLCRLLEIDIAVDLGGFTQFSRPGIFALRAAPIQASYIGYLGTMAASYMDYLFADPVIITPSTRPYYSEKIAYLPSYQANDSKRVIADKVFTRAELGLPKRGFVYCCFNNNYKILPSTFDGWMRILKQVKNSVLLLYIGHEDVENNLKAAAKMRGVDPERIIFASRLPHDQYLARLKIADLFLDTFPYNAGTTASDALWLGLPVLTLRGQSFASRIAASLLTAIKMPELIADTQKDYEKLAITFANQPAKIKAVKAKLAKNRLTTPLFNTPQFTRSLESAYLKMYEQHRSRLGSSDIVV